MASTRLLIGSPTWLILDIFISEGEGGATLDGGGDDGGRWGDDVRSNSRLAVRDCLLPRLVATR